MNIAPIGYNQSTNQINSKPKTQKAQKQTFTASLIDASTKDTFLFEKLGNAVKKFCEAVGGEITAISFKNSTKTIRSHTEKNLEELGKDLDELGKDFEVNAFPFGS